MNTAKLHKKQQTKEYDKNCKTVINRYTHKRLLLRHDDDTSEIWQISGRKNCIETNCTWTWYVIIIEINGIIQIHFIYWGHWGWGRGSGAAVSTKGIGDDAHSEHTYNIGECTWNEIIRWHSVRMKINVPSFHIRTKKGRAIWWTECCWPLTVRRGTKS